MTDEGAVAAPCSTKFAYLGYPHTGGTYTVYHSLRAGLAQYGVEIRWLAAGRKAAQRIDARQWAADLSRGVVVAPDAVDPKSRAAAIERHLVDQEFDGLFVNVLADDAATNAARYLPSSIRRVLIVHNITPGTYAAANAVKQHVHQVVGVSPRIRDDLVRRFKFRPDRTHAIGNSFDDHGIPSERALKSTGPLRVLSIGRVEDASKGTLWIPSILSQLPPEDYHLTVAGDGPDLARLRQMASDAGVRAEFVGRVAPPEARRLFLSHDAFLFPSRYEGFGITLVEAMAAGCVPVASRIRGVTDSIVRDGAEGLLFPVGGTAQAAQHLRSLCQDHGRLASLSAAARRRATEEFSIAAMGHKYLSVLNAASSAELDRDPIPWAKWSLPRGLRPGVRTRVPAPLKNALRTLRERFG